MTKLQGAPISAVSCPGRRDGFDLTEPDAVADYFARNQVDAVIHCAALVPKAAADYADDLAGAASVRMTENLVATGVPHIVFASSMTVYHPETSMPVREDSIVPGVTGYGGSKRRAEQMLCAADNLKTTILRLPGLFGPPRKGGLLHNAAMQLAQGQTPELSGSFPMWAALHVEDAADLLCRAVRTPPAQSRILNAGYADPMSVTGTVSRLAAIFGIEMPEGDAPVFQMDLTALTAELGLPAHSLETRLRELAAKARTMEERVCA